MRLQQAPSAREPIPELVRRSMEKLFDSHAHYYDERFEAGKQYAYIYPGMNRVFQAAGRVIRSEDERGVVLLVDDRFASPEYRMITPEYWGHMKFLNNARDLLDTVTKFWKK